jgi:predicted neuraminidase
MQITSDDNGRTWSKPARLPDGILGPIKNKPVTLLSGDILSGTSTESDRDGWRVHFERSTDNGKTWTATPPVNDGRKIAAIQPSILKHQDDRLQALGRTRNDRIFETWSSDNGRTWEPMTLTALPNPSSGTDAVTLADGRQLLVYNHTTRKGSNSGNFRGKLNVAVSDNGSDWNAAVVLEDSTGEFSYPAVIQTADGLVHITYTWKRDHIKHVIIDPTKLEPAPIINGQWPTM